MLVEIIVTNLEEALLAQDYGANRLELIHSFDLGGLSPDLSITKEVCDNVKIPLRIMIRPHGNNFIYNPLHIKQIMSELEYIKTNTKAEGIVFGALDEYNLIDTELLEKVITNKEHLKLTFHRAIDVTENPLNSYKNLLKYPLVDNILTSGGKPTALEGVSIIEQMITLQANYNHCHIIAGSGITPENAKHIVQSTKVDQIHIGTGIRSNNKIDEAKLKELIKSLNYL